MENNLEQIYEKYDKIVSKSLKLIHEEIGEQNKITLKYKKDDIFSNYILELCFFWKSIKDIKIYLKTDLLTFYYLKNKRKLDVNFTLRSKGSINIAKVIKESLMNESVDTIKKLYQLYYERK